MNLADLQNKDLKGWTLTDVHYMLLKDNSDALIEKDTKHVAITTDRENLRKIWESSWPRREITVIASKALVNKNESTVVMLDGKIDSENIFLITDKNLKEDIKNQIFGYREESRILETTFPE
ncbi:MAG: hypothetical protein ACD_80C00091G0001 [uncultured bacterium (gcode 4)]|uniref:Uncharacterized protein n=1 Tax=uncultured bacterium (gcode 4) TaxID=1234023 RepID=K1XJA0_9BACT|nr:MAG: hypothetical protein ACD_80C00091G0001 [uncultured bacterium (gcode 4)]HBB04588.1 hypothetical protein [Candidatus Gracilibacteria bacterium]